MTWLVMGGLVLCLAPIAGATIVAVLLAFHELRGRASRLSPSRVGRRASTALLEEFLTEAAADAPRRRSSRPRVPARRKDPVLLYELLEERTRTPSAPVRSPHQEMRARAPRPTRWVPLTA